MTANLLVRAKEETSLDSFVAAFMSIIGCGLWEPRQSSNYPEERYFRCFVLGLEITAAIADDSEFTGYNFELSLNAAPECSGGEGSLDGLSDCLARKLALSGYEVLRPFDFLHVGGGGMLYRLNPVQGVKPRESIITQTI